ncbi:unnamed protein product [Musa textilis]
MPRGRRTEPSRGPTRCSSFGAIDGVHLGRSSSESMWSVICSCLLLDVLYLLRCQFLDPCF